MYNMHESSFPMKRLA